MKTVYTLLILAVLFGIGGFIQGVALNGQVFMSIVLAIAAIIYGNFYVDNNEAEVAETE